MSKRLVLASNNAKKAAEMQALLAPLGIEIIPQGALGVSEAEEPYLTFVGNALAKARHAAPPPLGSTRGPGPPPPPPPPACPPWPTTLACASRP